MPPHKDVKTLQELAVTATADLVHSGCKEIVNKHKSPTVTEAAFDTRLCKSSVKVFQTFLRGYIAPPLWETIVDEVIALHQDCDTIIFSTLLHARVRITSIKIPRLPETVPKAKFLHMILPFLDKNRALRKYYQRHVNFWLKAAPMLTNIVEVDLKEVENEEVVRAFSKSCPNLQIINLTRISTATLQFVIDSCKNLRKFRGICDHNEGIQKAIKRALEKLKMLEYWSAFIGGDLLTSVSHPLNLRTLLLRLVDADDIDVVATCCPQLSKLVICSYKLPINALKCRQIFKKLAESPLTISKLTLICFHIDTVVLGDFLAKKGVHITELSTLLCHVDGSCQGLMETLSKCPNLTRLTLQKNKYDLIEFSNSARQVTLPKLRYFNFQDSKNIAAGLYSVSVCLNYMQQLTEIDFEFVEFGLDILETQNDNEETLSDMFRSPQFLWLERVKLYCGIAPLSEVLSRRIVQCCPAMSYLDIGPVAHESEIYFSHLRQEAKSKNYDIDVRALCELPITNVQQQFEFFISNIE